MFVSIMDKYIYMYIYIYEHYYVYNLIYARICHCLRNKRSWPFGSKNPSSNKSLWHHKCQSAYQSSLGHEKKISWRTSLVPKGRGCWAGQFGNWFFTWNDQSIGSIPAILKAYRLDPSLWPEDGKKENTGSCFAKSLGHMKHELLYQIHLRTSSYVYVLCHV